MGEFVYYIARSLNYDGVQFIQTNEQLYFGSPTVASWLETPKEEPVEDSWLIVAEGTLRVNIVQEKPHYKKYQVKGTVAKRPDGRIIYKDDWNGSEHSLLVHLALPPGFLADIATLFQQNKPSYCVVNTGRLCIGWVITAGLKSQFTFDLLPPTDDDFLLRAEIFIDKFDAMIREEPDASQLLHFRNLVDIHLRNVQMLEIQAAKFGPLVPLHIIHQLDEERAELDKYRAEINAWRP